MKHFCPMCGEQWDEDACSSCGWREGKQIRYTTPIDYDAVSRQRRREVARKAGRIADVIVNRRTLTQEQKDTVVIVLRECEKELING
jgi:uncharacterized membrane protein YvbJ